MNARIPSLAALELLYPTNAPEARSIFDAPKVALQDLLESRGWDSRTVDVMSKPELRMEALALLMDGAHGVERIALRRPRGKPAVLYYINTGDTYSPTLVRVWRSGLKAAIYRVSTWGDEMEAMERLGFQPYDNYI